MYADERNCETSEERENVGRIVGVEALKEKEGCNDCGSREADGVYRIDSAVCRLKLERKRKTSVA